MPHSQGIEPLRTLVLSIAVAVLSSLGTSLVRHVTLRKNLLDVPNERSSHTRPTPTSAGLAIVVSFASGLLAAELFLGGSGLGPAFWPLVCASLAIASVGLVDDVRGLSARARLVVQVVAAVGFCIGFEPLRRLSIPVVGQLDLGPLSYPISVLWLVSLTNFYNFMDGIDGIAGGTAVLVCTFLAIAFASAGGTVLTPVLLGAACLGFLAHNYPPAKIFMGDVGSGFLGFTLGALAIVGDHQLELPASAVLLALGMFILDTTMTLTRRIARGEKWYAAHRSHYYQRLVQAGWSHRDVDSIEFALTPLFCLAGYIYATSSDPIPRAALVGLVVVTFAGFTVLVRRAERSSHS